MKLWLTLFSFIVSFLLNAQESREENLNLVINPSFELEQENWSTKEEFAFGWFSPNQTRPLFCSPSNGHAPASYGGTQDAFHGDNYVMIISDPFNQYGANNTSMYSYMSTKLLSNLDSGYQYTLTMHVSLGDRSTYSFDRLGAYFSKEELWDDDHQRIDLIPQVTSPKGETFNSIFDWTKVEVTFTATGGENYMTIGQFYPNDSLEIVEPGYTVYCPKKVVFMFIDQVSLYKQPKLNPTVKIPNVFTPNNDGLNDELRIDITDAINATTSVYNRNGQLVYKDNSLFPSWDGTFNQAYAADGVYFVLVDVENIYGQITSAKQAVHLIK